MRLELAAMRWLWLGKGCHYILEQRSPRWHLGAPDILGVTKCRHLIEIEIKRSVSDFKADDKKYYRRELYINKMARQFYYLTPPEIVGKIKPLLPPWAGLMSTNEAELVYVEQEAPVNKAATRLTIKECVKLSRCMVNHLMSYVIALENNHQKFLRRDDQAFIELEDANAGTWQI